MTQNTREKTSDALVRCLLVVPRGCDAPADLLGGLRRRGVSVREVANGPAAMVELARRRYLSMILVEPEMTPQAGVLAQTAGRYHPRVTLWSYRHIDEPRLNRWEQVSEPEIPESQQATSDQPREPVADQPAEADTPREPEINVRLTDEELSMLLADDPPPAD